MNLETVFDEVSIRMRADFQRSRQALSHPGMKGEAFEGIFRAFLREYLPKFLGVAPGILVDASGKQSRQLDAIVFDAHHTPILFASGENRVVPVECAYAVVEVKAKLDSSEIENIFVNMRSVRALEKTAWRSAPYAFEHTLYGKKWDIWPVMYFVFAFDSMDLLRAAREIDTRHKSEQMPEWSRIDTVCVLDGGIIFNRSADGKYYALSSPGSRVTACATSRPLLMFYMLIMGLLSQAELPPFVLQKYLMGVTWGPTQSVDTGLSDSS